MKKKYYEVDLVYRGYDPVFELAVMETAEENKITVHFFHGCLLQDSIITLCMKGSKRTFLQRIKRISKNLNNRRFNRRRKTFQLLTEFI